MQTILLIIVKYFHDDKRSGVDKLGKFKNYLQFQRARQFNLDKQLKYVRGKFIIKIYIKITIYKMAIQNIIIKLYKITIICIIISQMKNKINCKSF